MKHWMINLVISTILLCNFFLMADAATAANFAVQSLDTLPAVETLAIAENYSPEKKAEDWWQLLEIVNGTDKKERLFKLYYSQDSGNIYWEIKPEQLNKNFLATVTLESGIGESGIYSGLPLADFLFYFRQVKNNLHFVARNVKFRADYGTPEQRSLDRSFSDSVLYSLPIENIDSHSKNILVNLDYLLMQDFPGLTALLKYSLQADYHLEQSKSYFNSVNSFPDNLEIDTVYGFTAPEGANLVTLADSRALSLKVHYSFSQLPEGNGYIPRLADDRVGYFITTFQNLSQNQTAEPFVRYINRWHLEPSDPNAPLSSPKKPIVFWIENAVPFEYRDAIREGVLMWNQAFAKAGFENALEVRQMPDDADWHPADVRYNTIRWFNSLDAGFAIGPTRVNPLTGEILDADVLVDANMVRSIQRGYRTYVASKVSKPGFEQKFENSGIASTSDCIHGDVSGAINSRLSTLPKDSELCYGMESANQAAIGALGLSLLQNTTPDDEAMKAYVHQYLRSLIAHEVGHTLGLRHNFHGSTMLTPQELNNQKITHAKGLTGSIMDYLPVNIAPQGVEQGEYFPSVIGPYDEWAIEYGYKRNPQAGIAEIIPEAEKSFLEQIALASPQPELSYATDEDIWDINPLANIWDMSSDVLVYSQWQMDNARVMWQRLDKAYLAPGESYSNLRVLFNRVLQYYFRNAALVSKYIGGQSFRRLHGGDDTSWAFVPVPLAKQRQALINLQEYVFDEGAFNFPPQLLNQLAPSRWQHWGSPILNTRLDYPIHDRILKFQSTILRSLLDSDRLNRLQDLELKTAPGQALSIPELFDTLQTGIWREVLAPGEPKPISSIRRSLQREHLNILLEMVLGNHDVAPDGQTIAWYELRQLQIAIEMRLKQLGKNLDTYTLAHLQIAGDRITKALNAQLVSK
ncbi:zinc-dependent metalloprotease [Fortiea contorta]|uniref:zinc-dependent metalloprotease n=1 Tax=Fortiea contorta TaxID=1892405 RepID=UPI0003480506|nr:zinc-dependent metalloprotease [Fortiea contorta]